MNWKYRVTIKHVLHIVIFCFDKDFLKVLFSNCFFGTPRTHNLCNQVCHSFLYCNIQIGLIYGHVLAIMFLNCFGFHGVMTQSRARGRTGNGGGAGWVGGVDFPVKGGGRIKMRFFSKVVTSNYLYSIQVYVFFKNNKLLSFIKIFLSRSKLYRSSTCKIDIYTRCPFIFFQSALIMMYIILVIRYYVQRSGRDSFFSTCLKSFMLKAQMLLIKVYFQLWKNPFVRTFTAIQFVFTFFIHWNIIQGVK